MKKSLRSLVAAGLLFSGSSMFAGVDNMSINVGGVSTTVESGSAKVGAAIGFEWSFMGSARVRENDKLDAFLDLAYNMVDNGYVTKVALGARYEVAPKIWLGGSLGLSGLGVSATNNFNSVTLSGFMYGLQGKYEFTPNHGVILEYRSAAMTDTTGLLKTNVSSLSALYSYSF